MLREIRDCSGIGYQRFEVKARILVESGVVPATGMGVASSLLPHGSLQREIARGNLRWFANPPTRLEAFLRIAGCPEPELDRWLARLAELVRAAEPAAAAMAAQPAAVTQDPPDLTPPSRRAAGPVLAWTALVAAPMAMVGMLFMVVRAGHAEFYRGLGFAPGELPIGAGSLIGATIAVTLLIAAVGALLAGAALTGAAVVPWQGQSRATMPAAALFMHLLAMGFAASQAVPLGGGLLLFGVLVGLTLGAHARLLTDQQRPEHWLTGWLIGLLLAVVVVGAGLVAERWSGSGTWLVAVLAAGTAGVLAVLGWWTRWELRRTRPGPAEPTGIRPAALLRGLVADLLPIIGYLRTSQPQWRARRVVISLGLLVTVAPLGAGWGYASAVGGAAEVASAVREYGYLPSGHGSLLLWSTPVRPATVAVPPGRVDPIGLCEAPGGWAASLVVRDSRGSWMLLRPVGPGAGSRSPELVWLAAGDYTVRPALDPPDGEPWTRPACDSAP